MISHRAAIFKKNELLANMGDGDDISEEFLKVCIKFNSLVYI